MFYNKKKRLIKELSHVFSDVTITDRNGKTWYVNDGKVYTKSVADEAQLEKIRSKLERKKDKTKFLCFDGIFKQHFSKVVFLGKEPVLVHFNVSAKETVGDNKSKANSTLKAVMEHDARLYKDGLTGVYNKLYLSDFYKDKNISAVAMIDVDDFKQINDNYGHLMGDKVLREIAAIIKLGANERGKVVRFGGDEFVIIFEDVNKEDLQEILHEISQNVSKMKIDQMPSKTAVSIGAVCGDGDVYDLIDRADKVMYQMKNSKR